MLKGGITVRCEIRGHQPKRRLKSNGTETAGRSEKDPGEMLSVIVSSPARSLFLLNMCNLHFVFHFKISV